MTSRAALLSSLFALILLPGCPSPDCERAVACVASCGQPVTQVACGACPAGTVDRATCPVMMDAGTMADAPELDEDAPEETDVGELDDAPELDEDAPEETDAPALVDAPVPVDAPRDARTDAATD